ncbi:hypothetical protein [Streptomyces sp. NPDC020597]|uniref:hypothetical protein n=1 Tax=unclassified Streptomyces TaxID=2593676 RepID=UPI00379880BA
MRAAGPERNPRPSGEYGTRPIPDSAGKLDRLRDAQRIGLLHPAWDPVDVLALINQIAMTWAGQPEIAAAAADQAVDPSVAARRAARVTAVERMFPRPD